MAKSREDFVKDYGVAEPDLSPGWAVVHINGKTFHEFTQHHCFEKPHDERGN